ncbi:MAG: hypothetical protein J6R31_07650 [Rikenellaceae bacterium]|jgi:uncharacterized protein YbjQ (UPF0145 family)|nr:hypothetical protein [Rikenellaceae bacterium]
MKKSIKLLFVAGLFMALTGCGTQQNTLASISNSPDVILRENNFKVVGTVQASSSVSYVFGIGGLSRRAIRENAIAKMMKNAELQGAQTIINITERVSVAGVPPLFTKFTVTTSGTIIEFTDNVNINVYNK